MSRKGTPKFTQTGSARPAAFRAPITRPLEEIHAEATAELACLTASEVEVLRLVARGYGSKVIANKLGKSLKTVEAQRHTMSKRLGMTYIEAAVLAGKAGWV